MDLQTLFNLNDRVAVVTGGSRGIDKMIVEGYLNAGCARIYISARKVDQIEATVAEYGDKVIGLPCDLSTVEGCQSLAAQIAEREEKVDILVNNAGITKDGLSMRMKREDWDAVIATNLTGAFLCTQEVLRSMMKQQWGRIINVASVVGESGNAGQANYVSSKAGLIGLTKSLAQELGSRNITVNAVTPGFIETDMTAVLKEEVRQKMLASIPLGRFGKAEDVAAAVRFLASEEAAYITGSILRVNGGMYM